MILAILVLVGAILCYVLYSWDVLGLDYSTDFHNATHTNEVGAIKVTDYLSDIFKAMYDTPDH